MVLDLARLCILLCALLSGKRVDLCLDRELLEFYLGLFE